VPPARLCVYAVATPYAWDVVESALRCGLDPWCLDNLGGADERLPGLRRTGEPDAFVLGLSSGVHRAAGAAAAAAAGWDRPTVLVDPTAVVARTTDVGHGSYLNAGVVVGSHTTVGCHVNVNRSASVGHDNTLGFAAALGPGAVTTGDVRVEPAAFVGAGATVLPGVRIGRRAVVGAGAVVTRDVPDHAVVTGNPARVVREVEPAEGDDRCPHC
jgi:sugar O-acyltransferase (sialic acid O-acetyltransferase NeuD family)